MWQVVNKTPFAALGLPLRDANGIEHWTIALRATFQLPSEGMPQLAETQDPVRVAPDFAGEEQAMWLREECDFAPFRPLTDVTLDGMAHPPETGPVHSYRVALTVAGQVSGLVVHRPRMLVFGRLSDRIEMADAAGSHPLNWSSATGGRDQFPEPDAEGALNDDNPIGQGWFAERRRAPAGGTMLLAPFAPFEVSASEPHLPPPIAFGPIAPHWASRRQWAGTFDAAWETSRHPLLPQDFNPRFHQVAPPRQQHTLEGREPIRIDGCGAPLVFNLPRVVAEAKTTIARRVISSRFKLISVAVQTEHRKLSMVWNSAIPCPGQDGQIEKATVRLRLLSGVNDRHQDIRAQGVPA